jgi:type IV fimbrial biogenesis protein FimT
VAARGFTLVEMLVAMALLATLATLAAPGLGEYLRNCRRAATVNALSHAIHAARGLASARGQAVVLCPSADGSRCTGGRDWSRTLLIQPDDPGDATGEDRPLRVVQTAAGDAGQSVRANRDSIRFAALSPAATTATLTVCDDRGTRAARAVIVSRIGRPRISDRDAGGRPLACP